MSSIPILMYHAIDDNEVGGHPYNISVFQFTEQLEYLHSNSFETILIEEYLQEIENGEKGNEKRQIIITFDDAQLSNYSTAFPLLKRYGFRAHFFIPTLFIGKQQDLLDREHIIEMDRGGMSMQSHTHTHSFLSDLNEDKVYLELNTSKKVIEDILNKEITLLSCPGGRYNNTSIDIARKIRYKALCFSEPGGRIIIDHNIKLFGRFLISRKTNIQSFINIVTMSKTYMLKKRLEYSLKEIAKRTMGNGLYQRLWEIAKVPRK